MKASKILDRVEALYGYPITGNAAIEHEVKATIELRGASRAAEYADDLVFGNIHWTAEHHAGEHPFDGEDPPVAVLAQHLCGLFELRGGAPFGQSKMHGSWLLDLNPRSDGLSAPLYFRAANEELLRTRWWLLAGPTALRDADELWSRVTAAHQKVADGSPPAVLADVAANMVHTYPRACQAFDSWMRRFGVTPPSGPFDDPDGERLARAHDVMRSIASVLVARATGDRHATLDASVFAAAAAMPRDDSYPPALLVTLLAASLARRPEATQIARDILDHRRGVALTQRWAELVVRNVGAFAP